jgi:hypothetical protein
MNVINDPNIMKTIPITVLIGMLSPSIISASTGARAGFIKKLRKL